MTRQLFLGLDVGTQSTKALLVDPETREVVARAAHATELIPGLPPGHAEQHPLTWLDAVTRVVREVGHGAEIAGVGVSGQQHGAVLLDAAYEPVRAAKLWCDTSTSAEAAALTEELGVSVPAGYTAPKIRWVAAHEPELWARTRHVLLPHDFVNAALTHELFTEVGDASGTGYLDVEHGAYDPVAMAATAPELSERVPPIVATDGVAARVASAAAERFGLPAGTPVSAGGGDNMMSAIGAGATRPGPVVCSLGTSGTIFSFAREALRGASGEVAAFRASSTETLGAPAGHLPLMCIMNCTGPLEEIAALTRRSHAELTELARAVPAGAGGVHFVPLLAGERVPNLPHARGSITGMRVGSLDAGVLYRAALEGVAVHLAYAFERLRAGGLTTNEVRLVGGAAKNDLWRSILASALDCPVVRLAESETAALGAALQAAAAVRGTTADEAARTFAPKAAAEDRSEPDPGDASVYRDLRARFGACVAELDVRRR